jgi:hypothetical protein
MSPWQNMQAFAKGVSPPIVNSKELLPFYINFSNISMLPIAAQ